LGCNCIAKEIISKVLSGAGEVMGQKKACIVVCDACLFEINISTPNPFLILDGTWRRLSALFWVYIFC
jgi:hypothetical protein